MAADGASSRGQLPSRALVYFAVIFVLALVLRVIQLDVRPFHHDEGVNNHFVAEVFRLGYYPYSHENYHGPLYFYLLAASAKYFGESEAQFRIVSVFSGLLLLTLPILYHRVIGLRTAILAALFTAISPSMVFYSRYTIHEVLFVFAESWFGLELLAWLEDKKPRRMYVLALAAAMFVSLKETFVISLFSLTIAALVVYPVKETYRSLRAQSEQIAKAIVLFWLAAIFIFTRGFYWFNGAREMLQAIPQWIGRGTKSDYGHFKPFTYYGQQMLLPSETHLALLPLIPVLIWVWWAVRRPRTLVGHRENAERRHITYFAIWSLVTLFVYSCVPYKTPWLVLNAVSPAIFCAAAIFIAGFTSGKRRAVLASIALCVIASFWTLRETIRLNYRSPAWLESALVMKSLPFEEGNIFAYVHTAEGMRELAKEIRAYLKEKPDAHILIGVDGYWPLPFYLKGASTNIAYEKITDPEKYQNQYDIIVAEHTSQWTSPNFDMIYHRLTGASETHAYFKKLNTPLVEVE